MSAVNQALQHPENDSVDTIRISMAGMENIRETLFEPDRLPGDVLTGKAGFIGSSQPDCESGMNLAVNNS